MQEKLIFEYNSLVNNGINIGVPDVPQEPLEALIPKDLLRKDLPLPQLSELEVVRHFTRLSQKNFSVDTHFYPLGSCTMKFNPKVNEEISSFPGFTSLHPLTDEINAQGTLELLFNLEQYLCSIFGYKAFTFQPAAGAHGELTALLMIKAYHEDKGQGTRGKVIIPDSSHGTNPASVTMVGYAPIVIKSDKHGNVDLDSLRAVVSDDTAGLMLTNPNTLGLFDEHILDVAQIIHKAGGLLYYDGANANAILGVCRPADFGFDVAHFNLHKTFSTPHGGGGPGAGPVGVNEKLVPFLPAPRVIRAANGFELTADGYPKSIGRVHSFNGNVAILLRAYSYILSLGPKGLKEASEKAVSNANYMVNKLKEYYYLPYDRKCQHEFVLSAKWQKEKYGVKALDIAKRLIDYGFHPPTIYFPLIVEEAMMIEPTESESIETLDAFCDAMIKIARECEENPDLVKHAPYTTEISRPDETLAARHPDLRYKI
ncbi:aminomethyl-transferring glycine dehydrogenase subunit GcvPB [Candidatus Saganbacteria bacterium]|nr:aminomethyl-transferring glycine dehydrogenase subunit GcvPB [Candidatus Saganbacteria bacterium]